MIINTAPGGEVSKLNVYCQPDLPTDKFDGILLQTSVKETLKKVIFDSNIWLAYKWQTPSGIPNVPVTIRSSVHAVIDGKLYFQAYDSTAFYCYDPATGTYAQKASMLATVTLAAFTVCKGKLYVIDGFLSKGTQCYDPVTNTWSWKKSHPSSCIIQGATATSQDNYIYVFGGIYRQAGSNDPNSNTNEAYKYNVDTDVWTAIANSPISGNDVGCASVSPFVYVLPGGTHPYKYNPGTDTYTQCTSTLAIRRPSDQFRGISAVDDKIYITLGPLMECFDTAIDSVSSCDSSPNSHNYGFSDFIKDALYAVGGVDTNTVDKFMFTAKQYPYSPAVIIKRFPKDTKYQAILLSFKLCDGLPVTFSDALLFKDGNITSPTLYVGSGTQWNKEREAQ